VVAEVAEVDSLPPIDSPEQLNSSSSAVGDPIELTESQINVTDLPEPILDEETADHSEENEIPEAAEATQQVDYGEKGWALEKTCASKAYFLQGYEILSDNVTLAISTGWYKHSKVVLLRILDF